MKTKQLIERNLKFDQQYVYLDITRGSIESGQMTTCDNCGKLITNMVHVANRETKKRHTIGTDCSETLSKAKCLYNNGSSTDYHLDIYAYNKCSRVATELNKGKELIINQLMMYSVETDKGKMIDCWFNDLKKYYPQLIKNN